jgi:catechol 2,3-dioxygenase
MPAAALPAAPLPAIPRPTSAAPLEVARVALVVNDLAAVARFYEGALGLERLGSDGGTVRLGAGGRALLELRGDPAAPRAGRREAGLFHTAFLLPSRGALGAWLRHAADLGLPLQGASDHIVSEALYLSDPEGNGIEVYADRPRERWTAPDGTVRMSTDPLDAEGLLAAAAAPWAGAPEGTVVGHVHLQVGDVAEAERFYAGALGLEVMARYPGAAFLATGGYHHHLGVNAWTSRGAGPRRPEATGLAEVVLAAEPGAAAPGALADPWGTRVVVEAKGA